MGNGVRQCPDCGWTCYGARNEMKKHRRATHPRPRVASVPPPPIRLPTYGLAEQVDDALDEMHRAELRDDVLDELQEVFSHLHADLVAIREKLGIPSAECTPPVESDEPPA